ncbi:MAG: hypothetical protein HOY71_09175, partial [Nonomuraea sp.]|nr:hypothetical protein [Nonomuraea sp.]
GDNGPHVAAGWVRTGDTGLLYGGHLYVTGQRVGHDLGRAHLDGALV